MPLIGSLNERALHAALKEWFRHDGDLVEHPVHGFVVDLVRDDLLIEIQTRGFSAMRRKLDHLLDIHPIQIVYPIATRKWITRIDQDGATTHRRRSPKQGIVLDLCEELVSFPSLLDHPNLSVVVALVEIEEIRRPDSEAHRRRRGFVVEERRLIDVVETVRIDSPGDLRDLVPGGLPDPFTTAHLADALGRSRHQAQSIAYCLRVSGVIEATGRDKGGILYRAS